MVASNDLLMVENFKKFLGLHFKFKDLGYTKYFLSLEIARNSEGISVCQRKYILDLLNDSGLTGCKPNSAPMDSSISLKQCDEDVPTDSTAYRTLIGRLLYLSITRPDVSFTVNKLDQFLAKPYAHHLAAAHRVLRYLKGSAALGLFFSSTSSLEPSLFVDADWAACADSRRSVSGYCLFLGSSLISWKSKKQHIVSRSSIEAEYISMALATCELVWIDMLLTDFGISRTKVVPLFCDNKAAVYLTSNAAFHECTKHIELDSHTVRDRYIQGLVKPMHVRNNI